MMDYQKWIKLFKQKYKHKVLINKSEHYVIRCPYCGDSVKHLNKGHLYITKHIPVFYCVRCDTGGHILKLLNAIQDRFTQENFNILKTMLQQITVNNLLKITYETETESISEYQYDIDSYIQSVILGKKLFMIYKSDKLRVWLKTVYKYTRQFEIKNSFWQVDKQIPIPILPTQVAQMLFLNEKNSLLNVIGLTEKEWKRSLHFIEDTKSEYVYFGLNGIQVRYGQDAKTRFKTIKYRSLSDTINLSRFVGLYIITLDSDNNIDLVTWTDLLYKKIITAKYKRQIAQITVRPVIAESITDLLAFAQRLYRFNIDDDSQYNFSLCDNNNVTYLLIPAFNRGIITAYQILIELFNKLRQNITFDKMFILADRDALEFEIQIIHKAIETTKLSKELIVLVPNKGKDYREAKHCISIRI